jgi:hypothetical protein
MLKSLIGNYIKWNWILRCLFIGLVLASVAVGVEVYLRQESGRPLDDRFFRGMYKGVLYPLVIPIMIYAVVILLRVYIDLKKHGLNLVTSFAKNPLLFPLPFEPGEQVRRSENKVMLKGNKGMHFLSRLVVTDRFIYIVSWMQLLVDMQQGIPGIKEYWKNGYTAIPLPEVKQVMEEKRTWKWKTLRIYLRNGNSFSIRVPLAFELAVSRPAPGMN